MKALYYLLAVFLFLKSYEVSQDIPEIKKESNTKYNFGQWVIYEMNIGAFTQEGTFNAAAERLSELKSLGIDVIWLMPIYVRDGGLNSPYAPRDYRNPNPSYGTISDLKNFVSKAHELEMEVWLDWVPSHTANNHPWLTEHPDYYASELHPFYPDVSQLNYENINLRNEMTSILKYWIDEVDIDGYRCDFISNSYIPNDYWLSAIPELKNYKQGKVITMLGEADFTDITRLFGTGWDYDYAWWFQETALWHTVGSSSNAASLKQVCDTLVNDERYSELDRMVYLTNHDVNFNHKVKLSDMYGENKYAFTVLIFTLYGMPLIYNGQEIGGEQLLDYFSDAKIDWSQKDKKMYNTIKTLANLKHTVNAFKDGKNKEERGTVTWINSDGQVAAYIRRNGNNEALVVINLGEQIDITLNGVTEGPYIQYLDSKTVANYISQKYIDLTSNPTISLDKRGYAVYVLQKYISE